MPAVPSWARVTGVAAFTAILIAVFGHAESRPPLPADKEIQDVGRKAGVQKSGEQQLLGAWAVVSAERDGKLLGPAKEKDKGRSFGPFFALKGEQIVFRKVDAKFRQRLGVLVKRSRGDLEGSCWFEGDAKPQALRIGLQPVGENWRRVPYYTGIFELAKDRLKICFSTRAGAEAPTDFQTKEGSDRVLILLERAKP